MIKFLGPIRKKRSSIPVCASYKSVRVAVVEELLEAAAVVVGVVEPAVNMAAFTSSVFSPAGNDLHSKIYDKRDGVN